MDLPKGMQIPSNQPSYRRYYHALDPILGKPKNRAYTATILSFLVISLFLWYAIRPTIQTILSLRREIKDNLEVNKQMEEKISNLVEAQAVYQQASRQLPLLSQALPKNPNAVPLLLSLQAVAQAANATMSAIQFAEMPLEGQATVSGKTATADVIGKPIILSVEGNYSSIKSFLDSLLSMRRIVTIIDYSVDAIPDEDSSVTEPPLRLVIRISTNYFPGAPYER